MDKVLIFLLKKGGNKKSVRMTTAELGRAIGMSQQNASRRLKLLEEEELIGRKDGIRITPAGMKEIEEHYDLLGKALKGDGIRFTGKIVDGLGKGKYYISLPGYKNEIKSKLGFIPYAGTLNVKLRNVKTRNDILKEEPIVINGFRTKERTFGDLFLYPCKVDGKEAALVFPLRSNHPHDIVEIIAAENLRKALGKTVEVEL